MPVFDQLAFLAMTVIAFQAIRNIAWIGLVALAVLPPLVDRLRGPVDEPRRLNRILALSMLALTGVALGGIAAKPTSWFTHDFPTAAARAAARAAGPHGLVFATSGYGDWLLWSEPQLAGRVAFDTRVELLTHSQLQEIQRIEFAAGNWRAAIRAAIESSCSTPAPATDLARARATAASATHVVFKSPQSRGAARAVEPGARGLQRDHATTARARTIRHVTPCECASGVTQSTSGRNQSGASRGR